MSIHRLVNVPTSKSGLEIKAVIEGEHVFIIAAEKDSTWRDGHSVLITDTYINNGVLTERMRQLYADDLARAIQMARDAGYRQAREELRAWLMES